MATFKSPFMIIPGVGPSIAADIEKLGYKAVADLRHENAEAMYKRLIEIEGRPIDRCILYVFRCAVYFSKTTNRQVDKLLWWNWKD